jgi:hypothetical protein
MTTSRSGWQFDLEGTDDPSVTPTSAPIGTQYRNSSNGVLVIKFDSGNTDWVKIPTGGGVFTDNQSLVGDGTLGNELMVNPATLTFPANPTIGTLRHHARDFIVNFDSIASGGMDVNGRLQNFGAGGGPAIVNLANNTLLIDGVTAPNGTAEWQGHVQYARAQSILRLSAWLTAALGGGTFNNLDLGWAGIRLVQLDTTPGAHGHRHRRREHQRPIAHIL